MASSTTLSLDRPLPSLPIELKREILRFCDPSSLAATSRSSLAFLELSSPLLYRDITIEGYGGLSRLLCTSRDPSEPPTTNVDPFLDLGQIKTFTFVATQEDSEVEIPLRPPFVLNGRFPSSNVLLLDTLTLRLTRVNPTPFFHLPTLLNLLNRSHLVAQGISASMAPQDSFACIDLPSLPSWTRLESVTFIDSGALDHLRTNLLRDQIRPFVVVVYDLVGRWPYERFDWTDDSVMNSLDDCLGRLGVGQFPESLCLFLSPCLEKVVFRVKNGEQSRWISELIRDVWSGVEVDEETQERWAGLIEFEEVDSARRRSMTLVH